MGRGMLEDFKYKVSYFFEVIRTHKNWVKGVIDLCMLLPKNKKTVYNLRNGLKFKVRTNRWDFCIINECFILKEYSGYLDELKKASVFIDIGGHIGAFCIFAASINPKIKGFTYEPFPENFKLLNENILLNKMAGRIRAFNLCVAGKKEKRNLFLNKDNPGCHSTNKKFSVPNSPCIKINCITIKDIFEENKINECDFLKLDCEGSEEEIISNTPAKYLKRIKNIILEFHHNVDHKKLKKRLEETGFEVAVHSFRPFLLAKRP